MTSSTWVDTHSLAVAITRANRMELQEATGAYDWS